MGNEYILVVDDDGDIRNLLGIYLENEGYKYIKCDNALTALDLLDRINVSLIILDVMLPKLDGISACIKIREKTNVPIIFISAKNEDIDIINGLMSGGDDYVTKPFNPLQLISRIKAQIRRFKQYNKNTESDAMLEYEDMTLDTRSRQVWINGFEVDFTQKEYEIIELLMKNKGNILSMKQIYESVWRDDFISSENTVMMHIANIRKKLNYDKTERNYIKTVWGRGYKI